MKSILIYVICFLFPPALFAHGPTPQKAKESITINASVDKVWSLARQFDGIAAWHPDLIKSEGDGKNQSGGVRRLTFRNAETLSEELDYYNEAEHEYSYRLKTENTKAFPLSSYSIELKVAPAENASHSLVTWKGRYYRGDTANNPPDQLNDAAAVTAMTQFIKNGLLGLKAKFE